MSDLDFIKDVIYGLKQEYGQQATIRHETRTVNPDTGASTSTNVDFGIPLAIPLPLNLRAAFMKTVGISRMAYLEPGQREVLIDKDDIPADKTIALHDKILFGARVEEITKVDDYEYAMILVAQS
jgi:hypothetical protein